ncbi:MAG: MarR family transcriptional regulator [Novosphingobium sp.]|nr:MarR family transcriptional regulator [Novosphingobium sp.]
MEDNIGTMLGQVARLLRRSFDERARIIGVTRPQWQVLTLLSRNLGINQGRLAELLEVEPITLGRMIDRLQDGDLVERRADPADRRAWRLFLTDKGNALIEQLMPFADETLAEALDGIDPPAQQRLMAMLDRIRSNLSRRPLVEVAVNG